MSLRRRSLNGPREQPKPFFPLRNNHVLEENEVKLPHGAILASLTLKNNHVLKEEEFKSPQGTT